MSNNPGAIDITAEFRQQGIEEIQSRVKMLEEAFQTFADQQTALYNKGLMSSEEYRKSLQAERQDIENLTSALRMMGEEQGNASGGLGGVTTEARGLRMGAMEAVLGMQLLQTALGEKLPPAAQEASKGLMMVADGAMAGAMIGGPAGAALGAVAGVLAAIGLAAMTASPEVQSLNKELDSLAHKTDAVKALTDLAGVELTVGTNALEWAKKNEASAGALRTLAQNVEDARSKAQAMDAELLLGNVTAKQAEDAHRQLADATLALHTATSDLADAQTTEVAALADEKEAMKAATAAGKDHLEMLQMQIAAYDRLKQAQDTGDLNSLFPAAGDIRAKGQLDTWQQIEGGIKGAVSAQALYEQGQSKIASLSASEAKAAQAAYDAQLKSYESQAAAMLKVSTVTQADLNAAKAGTYQDKPDENIRRMRSIEISPTLSNENLAKLPAELQAQLKEAFATGGAAGMKLKASDLIAQGENFSNPAMWDVKKMAQDLKAAVVAEQNKVKLADMIVKESGLDANDATVKKSLGALTGAGAAVDTAGMGGNGKTAGDAMASGMGTALQAFKPSSFIAVGIAADLKALVEQGARIGGAIMDGIFNAARDADFANRFAKLLVPTLDDYYPRKGSGFYP